MDGVPEWRKIVRYRFPEVQNIHGDGEWVVTAQCSSFTVFLYPTFEEATWKQEDINKQRCTRASHRYHGVAKLDHKSRSPGLIYVVRCGEFHKIGYSVTPEKRLKQLQTGNPQLVTLIGTVEGTQEIEKKWHHFFRNKHEHGEWFRLADEDVTMVLKG